MSKPQPNPTDAALDVLAKRAAHIGSTPTPARISSTSWSTQRPTGPEGTTPPSNPPADPALAIVGEKLVDGLTRKKYFGKLVQMTTTNLRKLYEQKVRAWNIPDDRNQLISQIVEHLFEDTGAATTAA